MFKRIRVRLLLLTAGAAAALLACRFTLPAGQPPAVPSPTAVRYAVGLTGVDQGLDQINSYRVAITVDFEGFKNGQAVAGRLETVEEVSRQPAVRRQLLSTQVFSAGAAIPAEMYEVIQTGDQFYTNRAGQETWLNQLVGAMPEMGAFTPFFNLEWLMPLPATVTAAPQPQALNGLTAQQYTFTEQDLNPDNVIIESAQGALWLAAPGNLLAQYTLSATVKFLAPPPDARLLDQGRLTLQYTLTQINSPFTPEPPPANLILSRTRLASLPRPPDAEPAAVYPGLVEYTSAISPISATLFYRTELAAAGWVENNSEIFEEKARLAYARGDEVLQITITPAGSGGSRVALDLQK